MKTVLWIAFAVVAVVALVVVGLTAGWALWGQQLWATGSLVNGPAISSGTNAGPCREWDYGAQRGMMRPRLRELASCPGWEDEATRDRDEAPSGIEEAKATVEKYLAVQGYPDLEVVEVMAFERNFYAIAREPATGIGAMELLVEKETGRVGPEMGPNMMWNTAYGMHGHGRMMRTSRETNTIRAEDAVDIAQRWLDNNRPGLEADEHADPFYGYYTIHTLEDGRIEGMLSVNGRTGQVWYHTWHGEFVQMMSLEHDDDH